MAKTAPAIATSKARTGKKPTEAISPVVPPIRAPWPGTGGKYAGIAAGADGAADYHLVLLDVKAPGRMTWKDALAWAKAQGADLPTRDESALLYAHLRAEIELGWHWTGTQCSEDDAWCQGFSNGSQSYDNKEAELRARLVRRLPLQSFNPSAPSAA